MSEFDEVQQEGIGSNTPFGGANYSAPLTERQTALLSPSQRRIWLVDQTSGGNKLIGKSNNITIAFDLFGVLCVNTLKRSIETVFSQHEIFYIFVYEVEGVPHQSSKGEMNGTIQICRADQDDIQKYIEESSDVQFDFENGKFFKVEIIRVSDTHCILLMVMSHFIVDGVSVKILFRQISKVYSALEIGKIYRFPKRKVNYLDYCEAIEKKLHDETFLAQSQFWKSQLDGVDQNIDFNLPAGDVKPNHNRYCGNGTTLVLPEIIVQRAKARARSLGVNFPALLFSAYVAVLSRYTDKREFLVGVLSSGRTVCNDIKNVVGCFFNTLPIKVEIDPESNLIDFVKNNKEIIDRAMENSDIPFEYLVNKYSKGRVHGVSPLVQSIFSFEKAAHNSLSIKNVDVGYRDLYRGVTQNDIVMHTHELVSGLLCTLDCRSSVFEQWVVEDFMDNFRSAIEKMLDIENPKIKDVSAISNRGLALVSKWNDTYSPYDIDITIVDLFNRQVSIRPDFIAIDFEGETLTYSQLSEQSKRLSNYILNLQLDGSSVIGICLERSVEMIVAIYATLESGFAYMPLDPSLPDSRIKYMLEKADCKIVVTDQKANPGLFSNNLILIDQKRLSGNNVEREGVTGRSKINASDLAYIIYTSGSTGMPKGVMIEHSSILNRLIWMQKKYELQPGDVVLQKTPIGFDVSVWELFWPLIYGGRLVIAKPEGHRDTSYLENIIAQKKVSYIHFVPSMLSVFLDTVKCINGFQLKHVICSGEALSIDLQNRFYKVFEKTELSNLYGPTEAAVDVSSWSCDKGVYSGVVPIGAPISNTQLLVLDKNRCISPLGTIGELYIGGDNLARGYVNDSDATMKSFVYDVYGFYHGVRFYKTGDLVRYRRDGNIEYIGRSDHQIKIRGQRIELGEIESNLRNVAGGGDCVVVPVQNNTYSKFLLAFVKRTSISYSQDEVIGRLLNVLPEYMTPKEVFFMDSLPLNHNGKVDRSVLLDLYYSKVKSKSEMVSSVQCSIEDTVRNIWIELLEVNPEKLNENIGFFDVGGDSLLANLLIKRISSSFQVKVPFAKIYENQTVERLSNYIKSLKSTVNSSKGISSGNGLSQVLENAGEYLGRMILKYKVPGATLYVRCNQVKAAAAAGVSDVNADKAMQLHEKFRVGCIAKLMTSALVMIFVEKKVVSLDEPIKRYWPEFEVLDFQATMQLSIRHLLTHTSGLDEKHFFKDGGPGFCSLADFRNRLKTCPQLAPVCEKVVYCSLGYVILGYFLEIVVGKSFLNILVSELFEPLGIDDYIIPPFNYSDIDCSKGYIDSKCESAFEYQIEGDVGYNGLLPAIGNDLLLSADDLLKFASIFLIDSPEDLLTVDSKVLMMGFHRALKGDPGFCGVGFGFYHGQGGAIGLKGNGGGHQSFINFIPGQNMALVMFGNKYPCEPMYAEIYKEITGLDYIHYVEGDIEKLYCEKAEGVYRNTLRSVNVTKSDDGNLEFELSGKDSNDFFAVTPNGRESIYKIKKKDGRYGTVSFFYMDEEDRPLYLKIDSDLYRREFG